MATTNQYQVNTALAPSSQLQMWQPQQGQFGVQGQFGDIQKPPDFGNWQPNLQSYDFNLGGAQPTKGFAGQQAGLPQTYQYPGPSQPQWGYGGWDPGDQGTWTDPETRGALKSYLENMYYPTYDRSREDYYQNQQLAEANRQYNLQFGRESYQDQYERALGTRRQSGQEWLAAENLGLAQNQQELDRLMALARNETELGVAGVYGGAQRYQADRRLDEAGLYSGATRYGAELGLEGTKYQADIQKGIAEGNNRTDLIMNEANNLTQRYGIDQETAVAMARINVDEALGMRRLDISQQEANTGQFGAETARMLGLGELGLGQQTVDINDFVARSNAAIGQEGNRIELMYRRGQISNEQRSLALAELTQKQNNTLQWAAQQLQETTGLGQLGVSRGELALSQREQAFQEQFRQRQLAQEMARLREQLASQERQAGMAAFGRWQAPQVRYQRSWS